MRTFTLHDWFGSLRDPRHFTNRGVEFELFGVVVRVGVRSKFSRLVTGWLDPNLHVALAWFAVSARKGGSQ